MEQDLGTLSELNHTGDTKYTWDRNNPVEVEAAKEHFESMKKKGFLIFKVKKVWKLSRKPVEAQSFEGQEGGYVYALPKEEQARVASEPDMSKAVVAKDFEPEADYVATPRVAGG